VLLSSFCASSHCPIQHVAQSAPPEAHFAINQSFDSSTSYNNISIRAGQPYVNSSVASVQSTPPSPTRSGSPVDIDIEKTAEAQYDTGISSPPSGPSSSVPDPSPAQIYAHEYADQLAHRSPQASISRFPPGDASRVVELNAISAITAEAVQIENDAAYSTPVGDLLSRRPPTYPVLAPEYRYCRREEILKPPRTHHCRICGKVHRCRSIRFTN
jgi:hypothetical protein